MNQRADPTGGTPTVVVRVRRSERSGGVRDRTADASATGSWRSDDETVRVTWWGDGPGSPAPDDHGITLLAGEPVDRTWLDSTRPGRAASLHAGTRPAGTYMVAAFGASGAGWLGADPLGLRHLYVGSTSDDLVVANRAEAVAAAISPTGTARRDVLAPAILAHTSYWVGHATGFDGVALAPTARTLRVAPGTADPVAWVADPPWPPSEQPAAEVAATVVEELTVALRAALAVDAERHVLQLTGGRDSRMLLAVALAAGIADRFTYQTAGPDDHPDVVIARGLCDRFGLAHETLFIGMRSPEPFAERSRSWVEQTGAMVSAWEAPGRHTSDFRVTGVGGEVLRAFRSTLDLGVDPHEDALATVERSRPGRLGLLRPASARRARATVAAALAEGDGDARRRVHLYYARNRMRSTRFGARLEAERIDRITPFASPILVGAGLATVGEERESGLLCLEVVRETAPELLAVPFAGAPWSDMAASRLPPPPPPPPPARLPARPPARLQARPPARLQAWTPGADIGAPSLVAGLFAQASDERSALIADALADPANPAWEAIDHGAATAAANRWSDLDMVERRELMGAISAALWASG